MRRLATFVTAAVLAAACSVTHAADLLRIGVNPWPGYAPLHLAADRHDWAHTLGVRLVEYPSATEVLRAFRNRTLEAASLTLDEVLMLDEAGLPVTVVLVLDVSAGGDAILTQPEFNGLADLRGRRVGVESGALGAFVLSRALDLHGLTLADVQIIHLEVSAHEQAFLSDQLDAVVTFEPVRGRLLAAGAAEIFDSRAIPGEIVDVLVVRNDVLERHRGALASVVRHWFEVLDDVRDGPRSAAVEAARLLRQTPEELESGFRGLEFPDRAANRVLLDVELPQTLQRLHTVLTRHGLLDSPAPPARLFSPALLGN